MENGKTLKIIIGLLAFFALVVFVFILFFLRSIFIPLAIAIILSFFAQPFLNLFHKKMKIPMPLAILIFILILLVVIVLGMLFFGSSINSFIDKSDTYRDSYSKLYNRYSGELKTVFNIPQEDPFNFSDLVAKVFPEKEGTTGNDNQGVEKSLLQRFDWLSLVKPLISFSGSFVSFMGKLILIMIFLSFLLFETTSFNNKLLKIFPGESGQNFRVMLKTINTQVVRYLNVKILVSLATGISVYLACALIGLDFPYMWGVFAFIMNFIPSIGSIIFFFMPTTMAVIQFLPDERWGAISAVIISIGLIEFIIGNAIDPIVSGDKLDLSPLFIILSLLFWGVLWRVPGMFLAVPIMLVIKLVCENIPSLQPVAVLLSSGKSVSSKKRGIVKLFSGFSKELNSKKELFFKRGKKRLYKPTDNNEKDRDKEQK